MRLLVVEDEKRIADSIKKGLVQEAYAVDVAYDGEAGYDLAASENYDTVILDLMLPKLDGRSLCRKLREEGIQVPILMLTALGELEDKITGLNMGADDYLTKPFAFEELLARIKALTRRPRVAMGTLLVVSDLKLDTVTHTVWRGKKEIHLSRKEFSLLEYLMVNSGRAVTKDQIIEKVWDFDADVLPNTVEVYIGYLRRKLDVAGPESKKLIQTVRGFGYKLE